MIRTAQVGPARKEPDYYRGLATDMSGPPWPSPSRLREFASLASQQDPSCRD